MENWRKYVTDEPSVIATHFDEFEWEAAVDEFEQVVGEVFFAEYGNWAADEEVTFSVDAFPLWNRNVSGQVLADHPRDLLFGLTVRGDYTLRWNIDDVDDEPRLVCTLSHHDVPTGGTFNVRRIQPAFVAQEVRS